MSKNFLMLSVSLAATGMSVIAQSANAFTLTTVAEGVSATNPFVEPKLFEIAWRAGTADTRGDYEGAIGPDGANLSAALPTFQIDWQKGVPIPWSVTYNAAAGMATMTLLGQQTTYYLPSELRHFIWDKLGLQAAVKYRTDGLIEDGTKIEMLLTSVNGDPAIDLVNTTDPTPGASATFDSNQSPEQALFSRYFRADSAPITEMTGTIMLDWNTTDPQPWNRGARGSVAFRLQAIESPPLPASIPEPSNFLGLLAVGLFGVAVGIGRRQK
jgi:hypothetical protein